jgi:hypothetical protein
VKVFPKLKKVRNREVGGLVDNCCGPEGNTTRVSCFMGKAERWNRDAFREGTKDAGTSFFSCKYTLIRIILNGQVKIWATRNYHNRTQSLFDLSTKPVQFF